MRIVVPDDFPPVYEGTDDLEPLRKYGEVVLYSTKAASGEELIQRLEGAQALICVRSYSDFNAQVLEALPELKLLSILGTGTDNVDLAAATERGIVVTNTPGASTVSVAELTLGLIFAVARHIPLADRKVREGVWYHREAVELRGKTLGIIGLGLIGQEMARLGNALGLRVMAWSHTYDPERAQRCEAELVELEELLRQADIISLHLRASPEAEGMIGQRQFSLMKPSAILVNTARASLVDQQALIEALKERRIAGAGFDTFWQEPVPAGSPLLELEDFVFSPHVGWVTHEASARLRKMPVDNIIAFLEGSPVHVVNPEALG